MTGARPSSHDARVTSTDENELPGARAWIVTFVATGAMVISYLDRQVLAALGPSIRTQLHIGDTEYGWLQSAFSLSYLLCAPFAGRMLERVGIRYGLLLAVLAWTLVSGLHAFGTSLAIFLALRIALGAAESPSFPGAAATIARTQPARNRARAIGVLFTGGSIGTMIATAIAPPLAERFGGPQGAFVGVAIVGSLWLPCWWLVTSTPAVAERLAAKPVTTAAAPRMIDVLALAPVRQACLLVACSSPLFAFVLLWGSMLLHDGFGVPQADVGRYLWVPPLFYDLGAVAFGHFASVHARKHGERSLPVGLVMLAALFATALGGIAFCSTPWQVVAVASVATAGGAGLFAIATADMIGRVGPSFAATAGGATASAQSIMYIVTNPAVGLAVDTFHGYGPPVIAIASLLVPGALVWLTLRRRSMVLAVEARVPV